MDNIGDISDLDEQQLFEIIYDEYIFDNLINDKKDFIENWSVE